MSSANASPSESISSAPNKKLIFSYTPEALGKYDGTDPNLPIYLALDGDVYDISRGGDYYRIGGPYHYLAGRDCSDILHVLGEGIIRGKYPIIGKYVN